MSTVKILLVDDVKIYLEVQKEYLRFSPVQVLTARNGLEALACAREQRPDLVVMDVEMPHMDGITCCSVIKKEPLLSVIPVILLSCNSDQEVAASALGSGCDRFFQKPLIGRDFLDMVHSFVPVVERRKPRVPCQVPVAVRANGVLFHGVSADIGTRGIFVVTDSVVEQGSEVVLSFKLPTNSYAKTVTRGRVAWVNSPQGAQVPNRLSGFGVEFEEITGEGVSHLRFHELMEYINRADGPVGRTQNPVT